VFDRFKDTIPMDVAADSASTVDGKPRGLTRAACAATLLQRKSTLQPNPSRKRYNS